MSHRLAVLISGSGTNLQAIIDTIHHGSADAHIAVVLSNKCDAKGLQRAEQAGIATCVLDHTQFESREAFDLAMIDALEQYAPDTLILAGFMRILTPAFVQHYTGKLINIHPSLLPKHRGLHTHARALEAGDSEHGCSVHFVTEELDGGPLIAQAAIAIEKGDTAETLAQRVQQQEHILYPEVVRWRAEGRLTLGNEGVELDGTPLPPQGKRITG